jgi:hypothetical protein
MLVTTLQSLCSYPCLSNQIDLCVQFELESGRSVRVHVEYWGLSVSLQVTGADHGYTRYSCSTETNALKPNSYVYQCSMDPELFCTEKCFVLAPDHPYNKEMYIDE